MKRQKSLKSYFRKGSKEDEATTSVPVSATEASASEALLLSSGSPEAERPPASTPLMSMAIAQEPLAVSAAQPLHDPCDLGLYLTDVNVDEDLRLKLATQPWAPDERFNFPAQIIGGAKKRTFQLSWLKRYPWLAYSAAAGGALCRPCVLLAPRAGVGKGSHADIGQLVSAPYVRWKNALEDFNKHCVRDYHKFSVQACDDFIKAKSGVQQNVVQAVIQQSDEEKRVQMHVLSAVVETILLIGRQELGLRGSDDAGRVKIETPPFNDGNFRALLRYTMQVGDQVLRDYMRNAPPYALYTSPTIQNEFIEIIADEIIRQVMQRIKRAQFFTIMADETTDIKGVPQMTLCVRYVDLDLPVKVLREDFLGYFPVTDATGKGLASAIVNHGTALGLDFELCRGQGYDGAGAMKGRFKGVQAVIKANYPTAVYTHCSSHCLNLCLNDSAELPEVQQAMGTIRETCTFFRKTNARAKALQQAFDDFPDKTPVELVKVCETRWVERHRSVMIFVEAIEVIVSALESLEDGVDDLTNSVEREKNPSNLHKAICRLPFLVTCVILERCMSVTYTLSKYLQAVKVDLFSAMEQVDNCISTLQSMRSDDAIFDQFYDRAVDIAEKLGVTPCKPRTVGTQRYRSNQPASSDKEYYKRSVYFPYVDHLLSSLHERFREHRAEIEGLACVLPSEVHKKSFQDFKPALAFYSADLHSNNEVVLQAEWETWQKKWSYTKEESVPGNAIDALNACNRDLFPNMFICLQILATLAVTTATPERSFSLLKRLKTWLRNRIGGDRLVGLALISVYRELQISVKIVTRFLSKKSRRMM